MTPNQKAIEILQELELVGVPAISLQKVIDLIGYKAQLFPVSDKTRAIACGVNRDSKIIMANAGDPVEEQRYAFAHAIGHLVLHEDGGNVVDRRQNLHHKKEELPEWEANQFADELLMESTLFLSKWDEFRGDRNKIAKVFSLRKERVEVRASALEII